MVFEERGTCPLCEEVLPLSLLSQHVESEQKNIRRYVLEQIKKAHPTWVAKDGACPKCWDYYRKL